MSWDVYVVNLPADAKQLSDVPQGWDYKLHLSRQTLVEAFADILPEVDLDAPGFPTVERDGSFVEIEILNGDPIDDFSFRVVGGSGGVALIAAVLQRLNLRAIDTGSGDILDMSEPYNAFNTWAAFPERALGSAAASSSEIPEH